MKNGVYFTSKKPEEPPVSSPQWKKQRLAHLLIYVAITLGAGVIYMFVKAKGTEYLTVFLLALFIMVTCVEVYFSNPDKKSFSMFKRFFNKQ